MIDWFRGSVFFPHPPLPAGRVLSIEPDGSMAWECVKRTQVRSSWETSVQIRSSGGDGKGGATHLDIDGNLTKFLQGHNAFGIEDLNLLVLGAFRKILSVYQDHFAGCPSEMAEARIKKGLYKVRGIDINRMYDLGNDLSVESFLYALESRAVHRGRTVVRDRGTVYLQKSSRRWARKFYNKLREVMSGKKHALPESLQDRGIEVWLHGKLRDEIRLLALELKDLGITEGRHLTAERVDELYREYAGRVQMTEQAILIDDELLRLPRALQSTYEHWRNGISLRNILPKSTFFRHRKQLLEFGVDINHPPISPERSNVVPLVRILEAKPVGIPDWAYEQRMVYVG